MYEAIVASLVELTGKEKPSIRDMEETEEEQRILKEVMQISKLEADR